MVLHMLVGIQASMLDTELVERLHSRGDSDARATMKRGYLIRGGHRGSFLSEAFMQKVKLSSSGVAAAICIVLALTIWRADSAALLPEYAPTQEVLRSPPSCPDSPSCGPDKVAAADFN